MVQPLIILVRNQVKRIIASFIQVTVAFITNVKVVDGRQSLDGQVLFNVVDGILEEVSWFRLVKRPEYGQSHRHLR